MSDDVKRCCILGTAPTWTQAPWDDPSVEMWGLNDMYLLKPPRADRWYDLHPFGSFYYRDLTKGRIAAEDVPVGTFVRPVGHLEWLAAQSIPVWVQAADRRVPRGRVFPREAIEAQFGAWFDSTPSWMLGHALLEGYREIHIYGIHLATEWEYLKQKPNLVYLIGLARGMGVTVHTPKDSPLLRASNRYAFEPDPAWPVTEAQRSAQRLAREREVVEAERAKRRRWWRRDDPILMARSAWLAAQVRDAQMATEWQMARKRATAG